VRTVRERERESEREGELPHTVYMYCMVIYIAIQQWPGNYNGIVFKINVKLAAIPLLCRWFSFYVKVHV
jgi:hypothetical protein